MDSFVPRREDSASSKIICLPDATLFRPDQSHGGSFVLRNDNHHFLQIQKSTFDPLQHNYSLELWFKPNFYAIITSNQGKEALVNPVILHLQDCPDQDLKVESDPTYVLINGRKVYRYYPQQWVQLLLVYGQTDIAQSRKAQAYINGKLVLEGNFLPSLNSQRLGTDTNLIGADARKHLRRPQINPYDFQNVEWSIFRLYDRPLSAMEVKENFLAHSHRFALNRENPHPITSHGLIAYFDAGRPTSYQYPSVMLNNIATDMISKIYQDNIYTRSNRSIMTTYPSNEQLAKVIAQLLARQPAPVATVPMAPVTVTRPRLVSNGQQSLLLNTTPEVDLKQPLQRKRILNYLDQNPQQLMRLLEPSPQSASILDWDEIQSTPLIVDVFQQFYRKNPLSFIQAIEKSTLNPNELNQLYTMMRKSRPQPIIDTFDNPNSDDENEDQEAEQAFNQLIRTLVSKKKIPSSSKKIKKAPTDAIMSELKKLRKDINQIQNRPAQIQTQQLDSFENQVRQLMGADLVSNPQNQIYLFEMLRAFGQFQYEITRQGQLSQQQQQRIRELESQLTNLKKMCLHAPNIMGYISHQGRQEGLINRQGQITYLNRCHQQPDHQFAIRHSLRNQNRMTLPTLIESLHHPQYMNHQMVGQIVDPTNRLSQGLIIRNPQTQADYLVLISPVPRLSQLNVMGTLVETLHRSRPPAQISPFQSEIATGLNKSNLACRQGLTAVLKNGDQSWLGVPLTSPPSQSQSNSSNSNSSGNTSRSTNQSTTLARFNPPQPKTQTPTQPPSKLASVVDQPLRTPVNDKPTFDPQLLNRSEFDFLDGL